MNLRVTLIEKKYWRAVLHVIVIMHAYGAGIHRSVFLSAKIVAC